MRYISEKILEKIKTRILCSVTFFFLIVPCVGQRGKIQNSRTGHR